MAEKNGYYAKNGSYPPPMEVSSLEQCDSKLFDDDGRPKRTGKYLVNLSLWLLILNTCKFYLFVFTGFLPMITVILV